MLGALWIALAGCNTYLDRDRMLDPEACADCHPVHYEQWSGSMHAYAGVDPIFLAMNARAQRETNGALGDFCVKCHAPVALMEGATDDGLNLEQVDDHLKGVTCFFCHSTDGVTDTHNNPLTIAEDLVMRAGIYDPIENSAHASSGSNLHDRGAAGSADMCGSCHDVVAPSGLELERTYAEWQETLFATDPIFGLTCNSCHMIGSDGPAADAEGVVSRRIHDHSFPGVDLALSDFPQRDTQRALVQGELDNTLYAQLCVYPGTDGADVLLTLENIGAGHSWPSGAAQNRRAWVELIATTGGEAVYESGVVADGQPLTALDDPDLVQFRDYLYDETGAPTDKSWEAVSMDSDLLPAPPAAYVSMHVLREWRVPDAAPDAVSVRVQLRPVGFDVLDDLVESGDLDAAVRDAMQTLDLSSTALTWTAGGPACVE